MSNVKVLLYVESRYKVNRKRIKKTIDEVLTANSVSSIVEVSVAIVGDRKMRSLNKKYRNLDKTTNVLSFPLGEGQVIKTPDNASRLGDIVISYPEVIRESARDEMLVDDKVDELVTHSMKHLLGIHHN